MTPSLLHAYHRCAECLTPTRLNALNDDMLCVSCGEPDDDPDNEAPTAMELRQTESTWSI